MPQRTIGWWNFDSERIAMVHLVTGQTIIYRGSASSEVPFSLPSSGNRAWLRFDYEDRETRYPLLVEWRNVPSSYGRPLVWRLDHLRSARQWRHLTNVGASYPPFGLWRRVDDCALDAFSCWPSHLVTGRRPSCIAINSGWFNGIWRETLYRAIWSVLPVYWPYALDLDTPQIPALDTPPPSPWAPVDALDEDNPRVPALWASEPSGIEPGLDRLARCRPHLRTTDGSRLLLGLPRRDRVDSKVHQRPPIYRARLLYADTGILTDTLLADIGRTSGPNPLEWSADFQSGFEIGLIERESGRLIPPIRTTTRVPGVGYERNATHTPHWVAVRLANALIDARLSHPYLGVDFLPRTDEAHSIFAYEEPKTLAVEFPLAGVLTGRLYAGTSLLEPQEGGQNRLTANFFDEERDGILRVQVPTRTQGHWVFDPESRSLINQSSDQHLQFLGEHDSNDGGQTAPSQVGGKSLRFLYKDSEVEYPLLVGSELLTGDPGRNHNWYIDHEGSARLWREQRNALPVPGYGLWRRVDSCAADALFCWPELEATGPVPGLIDILGGWSNGSWTTRLRRLACRGGNFGFDPPDEQTELPFVEALDANAPMWRFVDAAEMAARADLAHVQEIPPDRYYLPHDTPLTGFEAHMPHLRRSDDKAVILPSGCRGKGRSHDYADTWFLYADEEVFFFLAGYARNPYWHFYLARSDTPSCIGLRDSSRFDAFQRAGLPGDLFVQRKSRYSFGEHVSLTRNPSHLLAERVSIALLDAGLLWKHPTSSVSQVPERILRQHTSYYGSPEEWQSVKIEPGDAVIVDGGYVGGRFNSTYSIRATLAKS